MAPQLGHDPERATATEHEWSQPHETPSIADGQDPGTCGAGPVRPPRLRPPGGGERGRVGIATEEALPFRENRFDSFVVEIGLHGLILGSSAPIPNESSAAGKLMCSQPGDRTRIPPRQSAQAPDAAIACDKLAEAQSSVRDAPRHRPGLER